MKLFSTYAEYSLRTTFSEAELIEVLAKELPAYDNITSTFKLVGCDDNKVCFF